MPPFSNVKYVGLAKYMAALLSFVRARAADAFWTTGTASVEIVSGATAIGWFIVLMTSDVFSAGNLYDFLAARAGQQSWAWAMLALGAVQLAMAGLLPMAKWRLARQGVWFVAGGVWGYIAWTSILAVPVTTAAAVYSVMALVSLWALVRCGE